MLKKKLELFFLTIIVLFSGVLGINYYNSYSFKHNPLPQSYQTQINLKEQKILDNMQKYFGIRKEFPLIITDKIPGRLYGLTSYKNNHITIYLNKKVMQESFSYILSDVIAHEYAHALLFYLHAYSAKNDGHSQQWQKTCQLLGGKDCKRYVNQKEIILSKMPFGIQ